MDNFKIKYLLLSLLLIVTIFLVISQINSAQSATKLESTLFNILQFILSAGFAWFVSKYVTEAQNEESQRKFAIGAFRRIKEIELSLERTQKYIDNSIKKDKSKSNQENFSVIKVSLQNAQDTVRSSIADWSDIIGDEIRVSKEIERLKMLRGDESYNKSDKSGKTENAENEIDSINKSIDKLLKELPLELQEIIERRDENEIQIGMEELLHEWQKNGEIILDAFWEPDDTFQENLDNIKIGDEVTIARGYTQGRKDALLVYNSNNKTIAVVTNKTDFSYNKFVNIMEDFFDRDLIPISFNGTPIKAEVINIEDFDKQIERKYFQIKIDKIPSYSGIN